MEMLATATPMQWPEACTFIAFFAMIAVIGYAIFK